MKKWYIFKGLYTLKLEWKEAMAKIWNVIFGKLNSHNYVVHQFITVVVLSWQRQNQYILYICMVRYFTWGI